MFEHIQVLMGKQNTLMYGNFEIKFLKNNINPQSLNILRMAQKLTKKYNKRSINLNQRMTLEMVRPVQLIGNWPGIFVVFILRKP